MTTNATQAQNATVSFAGQPGAANGLALVRMTIGAMFVWVFFENLGKGAYTPAGYTGVINYYIKNSHSPAAWKLVLGFMSSHAAMIAPGQAAMELSLGACSRVRPPWSHSCSSAAFGSRNWARPGFGNYWSP